MSTDLEHDLRAAFEELAATTTISPAPRFGDVAAVPMADPRRGRGMFLAVAAVVLALVGGLGLLVRDRTREAPAPAATNAPAAEPAFFLFPDAASEVRFEDPRAAVDAYLADRVTTSPPGQTVTYTVAQDGPPFDGGEDRVLIGFSLTVTPDDPELCCDSGDGVASVALVDGAWFVTSAQTLGIVIDVLSYSDDGVVEGAYRGAAGGMYTAEIDDFGFPGPEETGVGAEQQPNPEPGNNAQFRSPGHTAPAVAVRFWHAPTDRWPNPSATFAEFIIPRGTDDAATISFDRPPPETTEPPVVTGPASTMLSDTFLTPVDAAATHLAHLTVSTQNLVALEYIDDEPAASVEPGGRLFTALVDDRPVFTRENEAWVRFTLVGADGETDGIVRLVDTAWATGGTPAWAVSDAGTRNVALASAEYRDRLVRADFGTNDRLVLIRFLGSPSGGAALNRPSGTTYEFGLGANTPATVALTVWSQPGEEPAFAEVLLGEGGEAEPRDFGALLDSLFGPDVQVTVPSFIGLTLGQARTLADDLGLTVDVTTAQVPAGDPTDGAVTEQGLPEGTVTARGGTIGVTIAEASGAPLVMPSLFGFGEGEARQQLFDMGLTVDVTTREVEDPGRAGVVLEQNVPEGDTIAPGTRVTLVVGVQQSPS